MVSDLVKTYHSVSDEQKFMFGTGKGEQEMLGKCPKCGADVVKGKFGIRVNYQVSYFANPVIFKKFEVAGFNFMLY